MRRALLLAGLSLLARALVAQTLEPAGIDTWVIRVVQLASE